VERTAELRSANQKLEVEIRERKHAEKALQQLSGRLLQVKDEEQRRIARELHDSTTQLLGTAAINLERIQRLVQDGSRAKKLLAETSSLVEHAIAEIRTVSYLLHPPILDELGLEGALLWYAAGLSSRSKIQVKVGIRRGFGRLPHELELAVFRIVQEALTNIHRHSGSLSAEISVSKDSCLVTVQITDHGRGIPPEILKPARNIIAIVGVGIAGMRERVRQFGGHLEIDSGSSGTSITAIFPISNDNLGPEYNESRSETGVAETQPERVIRGQ
jgi:signal transduction histidine kinase